MPEHDENTSEALFEKHLLSIEFPSDNVKWGTIRKVIPKAEERGEAKRDFLNLSESEWLETLDKERQLAQAWFLQAREGDSAIEYYSNQPVSKLIPVYLEELKSVYKQYVRLGLYQGDRMFEEQMKDFKKSVIECAQALGR